MKPLNLEGKVFGKWKVIERVENNKHGKAMWKCLCECGTERPVNTAELTRGKSTSCGCSRIQHGMSNSRFHKIWVTMKQRCDNPKCKFYYCYGGRGIKYQDSWGVFENFYNDMYEDYSDGLSLERVDVLKGYCKENCTWIPLSEQAKNRGKNSNNTSGVSGLYSKSVNGKPYLVAKISKSGGEVVRKLMSIEKHTYDIAFNTLCDWLEQQREIYGYGINHGK